MAALVAPDRAGFVAWTERGVELAESDDDARYWLGPLLNNLGWELYEADEHGDALDAFERALEAREREPDNRATIEIARYAVARTLRALQRPAEAAALLEQSVAWADTEGRHDDAATHAGRALELLPEADTAFERDLERAKRLRALGASRG